MKEPNDKLGQQGKQLTCEACKMRQASDAQLLCPSEDKQRPGWEQLTNGRAREMSQMRANTGVRDGRRMYQAR